MLTGNPGVENIVRQDLIDVLAQELDRVFIQGSGTGSEPTGITNTTGVLTDTWTGSPSALAWDDVL